LRASTTCLGAARETSDVELGSVGSSTLYQSRCCLKVYRQLVCARHVRQIGHTTGASCKRPRFLGAGFCSKVFFRLLEKSSGAALRCESWTFRFAIILWNTICIYSTRVSSNYIPGCALETFMVVAYFWCKKKFHAGKWSENFLLSRISFLYGAYSKTRLGIYSTFWKSLDQLNVQFGRVEVSSICSCKVNMWQG
jgi:hypothetical protein